MFRISLTVLGPKRSDIREFGLYIIIESNFECEVPDTRLPMPEDTCDRACARPHTCKIPITSEKIARANITVKRAIVHAK